MTRRREAKDSGEPSRAIEALDMTPTGYFQGNMPRILLAVGMTSLNAAKGYRFDLDKPRAVADKMRKKEARKWNS